MREVIGTVPAKEFIAQCRIPLDEKWGYIYGTWGVVWTEARQKAATREMTVKYGSRWIGRKVTDCSGLIRRALYNLGEEIVHHARYQYTDNCTAKGKLINGKRDDGQPIKPGTAVFLQGTQKNIHHVGVYLGEGVCVEAKGTIYGVVTSELNHWDHWGELRQVDYSDVAGEEPAQRWDDDSPESDAGTILRAEAINPNAWLNVRSGPGSQYPKVTQIQRGTEVEVLDAGEPEWWEIRYGGRIGWAYAEYLKPIEAATDAELAQETQNGAGEASQLTKDREREIRWHLEQALALMDGGNQK